MSYSEERYLKRKRRVEDMEKLGVSESFYQQELRRRKGEDVRRPDDGVHHSGAYHRYFEGYSEQKALGADGKRTRILRVYVGDYYRRRCSDSAWIVLKTAYILLFLAAAAAYIAALVLPVGSNHAWYVAAPGLCSVVPMMLLFAKLMACAVTKRSMVIYDYKHVFGRVYRRSLLAAGFLAATALAKIVYIFLAFPVDLGVEVVSCLGCLLAAGAILTIGLLERNASYEIIQSKKLPLKDGVVL